MWAFEGFPAILRYQRENDDDAPDIINKLTERIEGAVCSIREEIL